MIFDINNLVEVKITCDDDFLKIRETLTRIGIASKKDKKLFQSCHILHKRGRYFIIHFKELFALDGKAYNMTEEDIGRRNTIAALISEWGLAEILNPAVIAAPRVHMGRIKIISWSEKASWDLVTKYDIGKKKYIRNK